MGVVTTDVPNTSAFDSSRPPAPLRKPEPIECWAIWDVGEMKYLPQLYWRKEDAETCDLYPGYGDRVVRCLVIPQDT